MNINNKKERPKPLTNKSLTIPHCDVFFISIIFMSLHSKKVQWWWWQWIMKHSVSVAIIGTLFGFLFVHVGVGICLLRRICVYQIIVLYISKQTPHFLLTVFSKSILSGWKSMCSFNIKINFFHLDYSAFTGFIVCKEASHSYVYLIIHVKFGRQTHKFWEFCLLFLKSAAYFSKR